MEFCRAIRNPGTIAAGTPWLALGIVLIAGCAAGSTTVVRSDLDDNFELRAGQSAIVGTEGLLVGFRSVIADSRCAMGETCVWEGDAIVRVSLQCGGSTRELLELHTLSSEPDSGSCGGYSLQLLSLDPFPVSGRVIAPTEYVATFKVTGGVAEGEALRLITRAYEKRAPVRAP
jgi:hypothetical protein